MTKLLVLMAMMSGPFDEREASRAILRTFPNTESVQDCRMESRRVAVCTAYSRWCELHEDCPQPTGFGTERGVYWVGDFLRVRKLKRGYDFDRIGRWMRRA